MQDTKNSFALDDWIPSDGVVDGTLKVIWQKRDELKFNSPGIDHGKVAAGPEVTRLETDTDTLVKCSKLSASLTLTGFIFHVSRCGSTAVSKMLAQNDAYYVISEPAQVNSLLTHDVSRNRDEIKQWIRALVTALGPGAGER